MKMKWIKQFLCALHDHAGINRNGICKKCGAKVNLDPWSNT